MDQRLLIQSVREVLGESGSLVEAGWEATELIREGGVVKWRGIQARNIVFAQGYKNDSNPFFRELPFRSAKGELLEISGPEMESLPILNRGKWLLPLGSGRYRAGATYDLHELDLQISDRGKSEVLDGLSEWLDWPFEVSGQQVGIRPALHDFRPVMGRHPWYPELAIFNGLGSKGSLLAPLLAKELVDHLEDGAPLHPDADVERFREYL